MRPNGPRDPVAGPDAGPESPYPIRLSGPVIKGFGRGSKELGIPTANIPPDGLSAHPSLKTGVYYGVVALDPARFVYNQIEAAGQTGVSGDNNNFDDQKKENEITILPAVLSIGYNPFYKNEVKSIEIHIMPPLSSPSPTAAENATTFFKLPDFYSTQLNLLILGYIRPEFDYVSREALVEDIRIDCEVARSSLMREGYACYLANNNNNGSKTEDREWLRSFGGSVL